MTHFFLKRASINSDINKLKIQNNESKPVIEGTAKHTEKQHMS